MVGKWRQWFVTDHLPGLTDAPRSEAPRRITDAQVEAVTTKTLEETPPDAPPRVHPLDGRDAEAVPDRREPHYH